MSIQASAALRLMEADPAAAKDSLEAVRVTAKDALGEMRAMIGVLRGDAPEAQTRPTQGTDRLGDLLDYLESAGIRASVDESGYDKSQVPAYIDIALFGIAREAVTNIVRHSQATHASLRLAVGEGAATLQAIDDGVGMASGEPIAGHGLEGMRERVNVLGGQFEAGAREGGKEGEEGKRGGFALTARIPLAGPQESLHQEGSI